MPISDRWFRVTLDTRAAPCFVLVRAKCLEDALSAVTQRYNKRTVKEIVDPGDSWAVIDLRDLPEPADVGWGSNKGERAL